MTSLAKAQSLSILYWLLRPSELIVIAAKLLILMPL